MRTDDTRPDSVKVSGRGYICNEEGKNEYDQGKYRGNWAELQDEDDIDDDGMTRAENLEWAISQGWHRNDYTNYNLL